MDDPRAAWDRPAYTQVWRGAIAGHSVRTERWRYIEWNGGRLGAELYDYENNPEEDRNLAADPDYAETRAELRALIRANWGDPYRTSGNAPAGAATNEGKL